MNADLSPTDLSPMGRAILRLELANAIIALLTVASVHLLMGTGPFLYGVLAGALICAFNLRVMIFLGKKILKASPHARYVWAILFAFKLLLLGALVWGTLKFFPLHPMGFALGFSTLLPASLVFAFIKALSPEEGTEPLSSPTRTERA